MGMYIETDSNKNKAEYIIKKMRGVRAPSADAAKRMASSIGIPVCVVDNGPFEAAGVCYSQKEFNAFTQPEDYRDKTWLIVPRQEIINYFGPSIEKMLTW